MTDSQQISRNRPIQPKPYASAAKPQAKHSTISAENESSARPATQPSLKVYGGAGQVRTKQPALRGKNIDIII